LLDKFYIFIFETDYWRLKENQWLKNERKSVAAK